MARQYWKNGMPFVALYLLRVSNLVAALCIFREARGLKLAGSVSPPTFSLHISPALWSCNCQVLNRVRVHVMANFPDFYGTAKAVAAAQVLWPSWLCLFVAFFLQARLSRLLLTHHLPSLGHAVVLQCMWWPGGTRSRQGFAGPDRVFVAHSRLSGARHRLYLPQDAAPSPVLELATAAAFHARGICEVYIYWSIHFFVC